MEVHLESFWDVHNIFADHLGAEKVWEIRTDYKPDSQYFRMQGFVRISRSKLTASLPAIQLFQKRSVRNRELEKVALVRKRERRIH